jgi:hypothetical protein
MCHVRPIICFLCTNELAAAILNETNWFGGGGPIKGCIWAPRVAFRVSSSRQIAAGHFETAQDTRETAGTL